MYNTTPLVNYICMYNFLFGIISSGAAIKCERESRCRLY